MSTDPPSVRPDGFSKRPRPKVATTDSAPKGPTRSFERPPASRGLSKLGRTHWLLLALGVSLGLNLWQAGQIRVLTAYGGMPSERDGTSLLTVDPNVETVDTGIVAEMPSEAAAVAPVSMIEGERSVENRAGPDPEDWLYLQEIKDIFPGRWDSGTPEAPSSAWLANEVLDRARNEAEYTDIDTYQVILLRRREALELIEPPATCEDLHRLLLLELQQGEHLLQSLLSAEIDGQDSPALDRADQQAEHLRRTNRDVENAMRALRRGGEQDGSP